MSEWIDITRPMIEGMVQWPGDPPYRLWRVAEIDGPGTANVSAMAGSVHAGTHIDAPLHYLAKGADVAELPLEKLCGPARVVHVPAARDVVVGDLEAAGIVDGESVLLRTANEDRWATGVFDEEYHALSIEAARWLVQRGVAAVGVDYLSVDRYDSPGKPVHYALLEAGVVVIEGVDLTGVDPGRYEMIALPMKLADSDGAPARVIIRALPDQRVE